MVVWSCITVMMEEKLLNYLNHYFYERMNPVSLKLMKPVINFADSAMFSFGKTKVIERMSCKESKENRRLYLHSICPIDLVKAF